MKALPLSKLADCLLPGRKVIVITAEGIRSEQTIRTTKKMPKDLVLSFHGILEPEATLPFRNATVCVEKDLLPPLPAGEYFVNDLLGMTVRTTEGAVIGVIEEVFGTGSNDVYVVRGGGREYLLPAIKEVVCEVDVVEKVMLISPMKGLLDPS